jgi:hypothetical protein
LWLCPTGEDWRKTMSLPKKDLIATGLVVVAGLVYLLWASDSTLPGMGSTRASGIVVLVFGFVASASAVVPSFEGLLHGNKTYLAATTTLGLVAFLGGLAMLTTGSGTGFSVLMGAIVVLWLISTIHHSVLAKDAPTPHTAVRQETGMRH